MPVNTLKQRFPNCGPGTTGGPRVLPLWSSSIAHYSKKDRKNQINMNCVSHTVVENLKQFVFKGDKSRVVRRTFWLIKVGPTWKKFGKRCPKVIPERIFGVSYLHKLLFRSLLEHLIICYNEALIARPKYLGMLEFCYKSHLYHSTYYFLLFINDLQLNIQGANLLLFADDTNFLIIEKMKVIFNIKLKMLQSNWAWFREISL
jgi:hypothetical protein